MLVPVKWLREYVDIENISVKELEEKLIMTGSNTEGTFRIVEDVEKIVVGKILSERGHENADKLRVLMIEVGGEEPVQIVTGATNCVAGDFVPVALHGALIAGGVKIKKGKLRGELSQGMLCSLAELGVNKKLVPKAFDEGVLILEDDSTPGQPIVEALGIDDIVVEFEITSNRPDCLSMLGIARETAASFNLAMNVNKPEIKKEHGDVNTLASIEIEAKDLCEQYTARVIENVKVEMSPMWMQVRLMQAGMRPINAIVDITNYVMLEYGQPIHAFDLDTLADHKIVVRRALKDEKMTTLDDQERKLTEDMLMIADGNGPVAIAGVMGGKETEVSDSTKRLLIEVAAFDKDSIRSTSKKLGLRSEASGRFEKGVSAQFINEVADRVCELVETLGYGDVVKGSINAMGDSRELARVPFNVARISQLIGVELSKETVVEILERLSLTVKEEEGQLVCYPPAFRFDIQKEIDLVEEVARIYGYDRIPTNIPQSGEWGAKTNGQMIEDLTREELLANGINEITTYSFGGPNDLARIGVPADSMLNKQIILTNPLGEEYSAMRTSLLPNLMAVLERNDNRNNDEVRIFEIGNLFFPREMPVTSLPIEKKQLALGMYGKAVDFFSIKGVVENLLNRLGVKDFYFQAEKVNPTFHPGRCANIHWGNHILGTIGEVHPVVSEEFGFKQRTYIADLDFNILLQLTRLDKKYQAIPRYPAMERDLALLVKEEVTNREIELVVKEAAGQYFESIALFDVYRGKQIEDGFKSLAYSLVFRSADKTLVDEDVVKETEKILKALEEKIGAELR